MRSLLLLTLFCTVVLHAQDRILGLVEIPALPGFEQLPAARLGIAVRAEPSVDSTILAELRGFDAIEFREHGYEARSAAVYKAEIINDAWWYNVRLVSGQRGWISGENAGPVHWIEDLLEDSMTYLTESWDKKLRLAAGKPASEFRMALDSREAAVVIADKTSIDGQIWLLVVVTESPCEGGGDRAVLGAGWVPLYAADNSPNVWFYSRGC